MAQKSVDVKGNLVKANLPHINLWYYKNEELLKKVLKQLKDKGVCVANGRLIRQDRLER